MKNMAKSNNQHEVTRQSMNLFSIKIRSESTWSTKLIIIIVYYTNKHNYFLFKFWLFYLIVIAILYTH